MGKPNEPWCFLGRCRSVLLNDALPGNGLYPLWLKPETGWQVMLMEGFQHFCSAGFFNALSGAAFRVDSVATASTVGP